MTVLARRDSIGVADVYADAAHDDARERLLRQPAQRVFDSAQLHEEELSGFGVAGLCSLMQVCGVLSFRRQARSDLAIAMRKKIEAASTVASSAGSAAADSLSPAEVSAVAWVYASLWPASDRPSVQSSKGGALYHVAQTARRTAFA